MNASFEIFGKIFFIAQQWQALGDKEMSRIGLTTKQWMLLVVLEKLPVDPLPSVSESAIVFGTSRQNVKRIAADLEEKGFIEIVRDANDQRIQRLRLTGQHRPLFESAENLHWQSSFISRLFEGLDTAELNEMHKGISILLKNILHYEQNV